MKKQELKKIIKENITDWLAERSQNEGDSGYMGYTKKAPKVKMEDQIGEMYYVSRPSKKSTMEELVGKGDVFEFASTPGGSCSYKKVLYRLPLVAVVNDNARGLHYLLSTFVV